MRILIEAWTSHGGEGRNLSSDSRSRADHVQNYFPSKAEGGLKKKSYKLRIE